MQTNSRTSLLKSFIIFFLLAPLLTGCEEASNNENIGKLVQKLETTLQDAQDTIEGLTKGSTEVPKLATKEVEKLFTFEYRVVEYSTALSAGALEKNLANLGQDRWNCFHVEMSTSSIRFFCKRRPKTYLRYIPKLL